MFSLHYAKSRDQPEPQQHHHLYLNRLRKNPALQILNQRFSQQMSPFLTQSNALKPLSHYYLQFTSSSTLNELKITLFYLQSCVYFISERCSKRSVLVQFPLLQDFWAAPDRLTLCCRTSRPLSQSQTSSHVDTKWRAWGLCLE